MTEGAARIDLDGAQVGVVTAEQAANARRRIERIEQRHSARVRARGLAIEAADKKAKADAEEVKRATTAGTRKPLLRLPRQRAASQQAV